MVLRGRFEVVRLCTADTNVMRYGLCVLSDGSEYVIVDNLNSMTTEHLRYSGASTSRSGGFEEGYCRVWSYEIKTEVLMLQERMSLYNSFSCSALESTPGPGSRSDSKVSSSKALRSPGSRAAGMFCWSPSMRGNQMEDESCPPILLNCTGLVYPVRLVWLQMIWRKSSPELST